MKQKRTILILISASCCLMIIILPFFISTCGDSTLSIISVSLTGLGAISSTFTLFIAILLYKKYSMEAKFLERQTDKTLELVDYLKGKIVNISDKSFKFFSRFNVDKIEELNTADFFNSIKTKTIIINKDDYEKFFNVILEIKRSYWLPEEIKKVIQPLEYYAIGEKIDNPKSNMYARMDFRLNENKEYVMPYPRMTVVEYISRKNNLIMTISKWLDNHCDIKLDLKLEEPIKY